MEIKLGVRYYQQNYTGHIFQYLFDHPEDIYLIFNGHDYSPCGWTLYFRIDSDHSQKEKKVTTFELPWNFQVKYVSVEKNIVRVYSEWTNPVHFPKHLPFDIISK